LNNFKCRHYGYFLIEIEENKKVFPANWSEFIANLKE